MPEEPKDALELEKNTRDIITGFLTSYISCFAP